MADRGSMISTWERMNRNIDFKKRNLQNYYDVKLDFFLSFWVSSVLTHFFSTTKATPDLRPRAIVGISQHVFSIPKGNPVRYQRESASEGYIGSKEHTKRTKTNGNQAKCEIK